MRARGSVRGRVRVQVRVWVRARVRRGHLVGLHLSLAREAGDLALHDDGAGRLHDVLEGDSRRLDPHLHLVVHRFLDLGYARLRGETQPKAYQRDGRVL